MKITVNDFQDAIKNLPTSIENVVKQEIRKKLFNNLIRLDSKIGKLDAKVNRVARNNTANLKVKVDAVNVKKNSCLSKWDKLEVDLCVEKLQKTIFVIHQKNLRKKLGEPTKF